MLGSYKAKGCLDTFLQPPFESLELTLALMVAMTVLMLEMKRQGSSCCVSCHARSILLPRGDYFAFCARRSRVGANGFLRQTSTAMEHGLPKSKSTLVKSPIWARAIFGNYLRVIGLMPLFMPGCNPIMRTFEHLSTGSHTVSSSARVSGIVVSRLFSPSMVFKELTIFDSHIQALFAILSEIPQSNC